LDEEEPLEDEESLDSGDEVPSDEDEDELVVPEDDDVLATLVVPIEPSNTITPQARTNADSVVATTVRRIRATRRARSARRARPRAARSDGWGVGMAPNLRAQLQCFPSGSWEIAGKSTGRPT
jgi:hypothetical protein